MFAAIRPEDAVPLLAFVSIVYLVLVFLILRGTQTIELKLMALGLVTALLAVWCGQLGEHGGTTVQMGPGQAGGVFFGGDVGGILGRIALLLVLAGVIVGILKRLSSSVVSPSREETIREYKN